VAARRKKGSSTSLVQWASVNGWRKRLTKYPTTSGIVAPVYGNGSASVKQDKLLYSILLFKESSVLESPKLRSFDKFLVLVIL
jgi:hypothetical protein